MSYPVAMTRRRGPRSRCPINFALELLGDPWSMLVLRDAILFQKRRFREFLASEERIATNILSDRLERLVAAGVLAKSGRPAAYRPTPKGLDLLPVLVELSAWGARHDPRTAAPKSFLRAYAADREGLLRGMRRAAEAGRPFKTDGGGGG